MILCKEVEQCLRKRSTRRVSNLDRSQSGLRVGVAGNGKHIKQLSSRWLLVWNWLKAVSHGSQKRGLHPSSLCTLSAKSWVDCLPWTGLGLSKLNPWKLTWQWKITILNRRYIFKWLVSYRHVSFPGCSSALGRFFLMLPSLKGLNQQGIPARMLHCSKLRM